MSLRLFDTATHEVRDLVPLVPGEVGIYLCGATVQSPPHIGHLRSAVAFDVLTHGTTDCRAWSLTRRKTRLRSIVPSGATSILYAESIVGQGVALFGEACARDLEGIVAKRRDSLYDPKHPWTKIKNPAYSQKVGRHELFNAKRR